MPTLVLRFPGGRYHATPWGHHVNEGLVEWPPSPWRLLRALLATGYATLGWQGDLRDPLRGRPPDEARMLIGKLASCLPRYRLPPSAGAHTRHYMPLAVFDKGREKTTLVFDTWAQVGEGELAVTWDVELTDEESVLLSRLAERMGYLGRSESWVNARLAAASDPLPEGSDCHPSEDSSKPGQGWEQIALLAAELPQRFDAWRADAVAQALAPFPLPEHKKPTKSLLTQRAKAQAPFPADLIACLQTDTNWQREHGWSQPPGSRKVLYWRRTDALEAGAPRPHTRIGRAAAVEAMLLSLSTESGNDHALPPISRTLPQAERLHRQLGDTLKRLGIGHSQVLSGCDAQQRPLKGAHQHSHLIPLDLDGDGHLDHILIWAPMGLDADAQRAVRAVRQTYAKGGVGALKLALAAVGSLDDLLRLPERYGDNLRGLVLAKPGATEWVSRTPFVPPRYLKPRGVNSLWGQVAAELASRAPCAPPELAELQILDMREHDQGQQDRYLRQRHFIRVRRHGPPPPTDVGYTLRIRLTQPFQGPLALGYGSHFGLGVFERITQESVMP